ncbi:Tat pathway signal sequence domain protein [Streptomyces platensis]|uniref:Tat pathway signal sequence domain protein n=1 Tax=Streptomyces platensis TaxID=58346 RepID=UPI002E165154|nr:Tat pathway signal sequence domain protein [Streptomyces platensis]WTI55252.1 Tat pathway signal sequence domain protein [Streptomyces platensis]
MRHLMHRHLGKAVAGAAVALTGTAAMVAITLPSDAGATGGRDPRSRPAAAAPGRDQGPPPPGVVEKAPTEGERGRGRDPLTDDELRRAQDLALPPTRRGAAADVTGRPGPERLTTDLAELTPAETGLADPPRRALVSFYDYKSDSYLTKTINLTTSKVESTDTQHGVQPPPSHAEAVEAARLLIAAPLGSGLRQDYRDATGHDLTGPDPLSVTGFVYRGRAEGDAPGALGDCGEHRCIRLFTKVKNGRWIDTRRFVIDLSARTVARLG